MRWFGSPSLPSDAADLLRESLDLLDGDQAGGSDPGSRGEGGFYLDCVALAHVKDSGGVEALSGSLRANLRAMKVRAFVVQGYMEIEEKVMGCGAVSSFG